MQAAVKNSAVLIVDIADSVRLREDIGDQEAERRIRELLDRIITAGRRRGGEFIKSYGDDVLLVFARKDCTAAAETAVLGQREAVAAGLGLYSGLHTGIVEFRQTMGHPDAVGQTVSIAARLHKLTEGAPGQIFLSEDVLGWLKPDIRKLASPYGPRQLKGVGLVNVWTLNWHESSATFRMWSGPKHRKGRPLLLRHGDAELRLDEDRPRLIGRGRDCDLRVPDTEPRVSSKHLQLECSDGCWLIQDVSRNGTWLRETQAEAARQLPFGVKVMLPPAGELSLGRPFEADAGQQFMVRFASEDTAGPKT